MNGYDEFGKDPAGPGSTPGSSAAGAPQPGTVPPPSYTYTGAGPDYTAPPAAGYAPPPAPGLPNPATAFVLGFIPGVGAMYNGQFGKGIANIAIFAVLISLTDHASGIFGIFVAGWVAFMVFDAFQTAKARQFGLPLPNPFGLNDIGERLGFGPNAGWNVGSTPAGSAPNPPSASASAAAAAGYHVDPQGNVYPAAAAQDPYTAPPAGAYGAPQPAYPPQAATYPPPAAPYAAQPPYGTAESFGFADRNFSYAQSSYAPYAEPPAPGWVGPPPPVFTPAAMRPQSGLASIPAGAIWLIALGVLALLGSLHRFYFANGGVTSAILLMALSLFLLFRKWQQTTLLYPDGSPQFRWALIRSLKGPVTLFLVAILVLLDSVDLLHWDSSWPILLIFLGLWILIERVIFNRMAQESYVVPPYATATPADPAPEPRSTTTPTSIMPSTFSPIDDKEGR